MDEENLNRQVDRKLASLQAEFDEIPPEHVTAVGEEYYDRLRANARIKDFIPVLVWKHTRQELISIDRDDLRSAA